METINGVWLDAMKEKLVKQYLLWIKGLIGIEAADSLPPRQDVVDYGMTIMFYATLFAEHKMSKEVLDAHNKTTIELALGNDALYMKLLEQILFHGFSVIVLESTRIDLPKNVVRTINFLFDAVSAEGKVVVE